jgi:cystathionine beta-lyase
MKQKKYNIYTKCINETTSSNHDYVNFPIQKASTVIYKNIAAMERAMSDKFKNGNLVYGRFGTPICKEFEYIMASLECGYNAICTSSGLSAITSSIFSFIKTGDHILISDSVYIPTRNFCNSLERFGIEVDYYDPNADSKIKEKIKENTRIIFMESPGSNTFEIQDISKITEICIESGIISIIDNTWGTPINFNPINYGANVVVHSCTKYITGHSDNILGVIVADSKETYESIRDFTIKTGQCAGNEDIYSAIRGIRTLPMRLKYHEEQADKLMCFFLKQKDIVVDVISPKLPSHGDHFLWKQYFKGASGVFGILLNENITKKSLEEMFDSLKIFRLGHSWGGYESLFIPLDNPNSYRISKKWNKKGWLLRISVGFEDMEDLIEDVKNAFSKLMFL